jgi:integrase
MPPSARSSRKANDSPQARGAKAKVEVKGRQISREHSLPPNIPFSDAVDMFLISKESRIQQHSLNEYRRLLTRHFPFKRMFADVNHRDLIRRISSIPAVWERDHAIGAVKTLFFWGVSEGYRSNNPATVIARRPGVRRPNTRIRLLSDEELSSIWRACDVDSRQLPSWVIIGPRGRSLAPHFTRIVRLMILTGHKAAEIARWRKTCILDDVYCSPETEQNNARKFPLTPKARKIVQEAVADSDLLFPAKGSRNAPFNNWLTNKAALDQLTGLANFALEDIGKTVATGMLRLGIKSPVVQSCLNQESVEIRVKRTVSLSRMREAMLMWEQHVQQNVIER